MNIKILNKVLEFPKHLWLKHNSTLLVNHVKSVFNVDITKTQYTIEDIVDTIDVLVLDNYFRNHWGRHDASDPTIFSGENVGTAVNPLKPNKVLDVGCGYNEYKDIIDADVIGIDPYNANADEMVTLEDYSMIGDRYYNIEHNFDVILCLGSINFGSIDKISRELSQVVSMLSPNGTIFFRVNPGFQHPSEHSIWIDFFKWDIDIIHLFAKEFNMEMSEIVNEYGTRLVFSWKSNNK